MGMIINPYLVQPSGDADAQAFITAAGITDSTQKSAIETLVTDLKGYGIWTKMKAVYPFVGGTASTHKWNLKDPRDLDAAFRLVFSGGWTHSSTGALPNGTNAYADTKLTPSGSLSLTSNHLGIYSRTNLATSNYSSHGQRHPTGDPAIQLAIRRVDQLAYYNTPGESSGNNTANGGTQSNSAAFYLGSRIANNDIRLFRNSTQIANNTNTMVGTTLSSDSMYLSAMNQGGFPNSVTYDNKEFAFASIGDGLTSTEAANFYTAIQAFQTTLSRNV